MISSGRRAIGWLSRRLGAALLISLLGVSTARAQPSAADKETARSMMRQGDAAFEARSYASARDAYAAAHALMRVPTTGMALARAQEKLGLLVEARDTALEVTRLARRPDDPAPYEQARAEATKLAEALTGRVPSLQVRWAPAVPASDLEVRVDGALVPASAASSPRKLNPGKHRVELRAVGHLTVVREVTAAEGRQVTVDVQLVRDGSDKPRPAQPPPDDAPAPVPALSIVAFGVGAVGVGMGAVTGIMSLNETAELEDVCDDDGGCPPDTAGQRDRARTLATLSNVSFVVGAVGITAGVLLLVIRAKSHKPATGGGASFVQPTGSGVRFRF